MLAYLTRSREKWASRLDLADLLWSKSDPKNRKASLRQSIRKLKSLERSTGFQFLQASNRVVQLVHGAIHSDVDKIIEALKCKSDRQISTANRLYAPVFLEGLDGLGDRFDAWRCKEADVVRNQFLKSAATRIEKFEDPANVQFAGLARFMLKVEPSYEGGHKYLVQHYNASGEVERAARQIADSNNDLKEREVRVDWGSVDFDPYNVLPPPLLHNGIFPKIHVAVCNEVSIRKEVVCSDIVDSLSRSREVTLHPMPSGGEKHRHRLKVGLDSESGGAFALEIQEEPGTDKVSISLTDRQLGRQVYYTVFKVPHDLTAIDRRQLTNDVVRKMQYSVREHYQRSGSLTGAIYRKISQVNELSTKFDQRANVESLNILSGLEIEVDDCSLIHALKAAALLKQRLFFQVSPRSDQLLREAERVATRAVAADPWSAYSNRILGFATHLSGKLNEGRDHMMTAQSLAPLDPGQAIATAEACAFVDDIDNALIFADKARDMAVTLPRYFNGYMAIIQFAAGKFEEAAEFSVRGPVGIMDTQAIRIASLWQVGDRAKAKNELNEILLRLQKQNLLKNIDNHTAIHWLTELNTFMNPKISNIYRSNLLAASSC